MDKEKTFGEEIIESLEEFWEYEKGNVALKTTTMVTEEITLPNGETEEVVYRITRTTTPQNDPLKDATEPEILAYAKANLGLKTPTMIVDRSYWQNPQGDFTVVPFEEVQELEEVAV
ncbi:MAG: hypothetical protein FWG68_11955 [Defluviitaleaceae bacterium]|nr:hypothetical protein [Defluviitaleaceae bacterium]